MIALRSKPQSIYRTVVLATATQIELGGNCEPFYTIRWLDSYYVSEVSNLWPFRYNTLADIYDDFKLTKKR